MKTTSPDCFPKSGRSLIRSSWLVAVLVALFVPSSRALATTWYVPSQCPTIHAGIDSAAAGVLWTGFLRPLLVSPISVREILCHI